MYRISYILTGIMWIVLGISIIVDPIFYSSYLNKVVNFTGIEWFVGACLIIVGCYVILSSFQRKTIEAEKKRKEDKKVMMCRECVKPFYKKNCNDLKCPECKAPVEELIGFYERHPELKKNKTENN